MPKSLESLLRQLRLYVVGPRSVESALQSFRRIQSDLQQTSEHYDVKASADLAAANALVRSAETNSAHAAHARRVQARLSSLLA